MEQNNEETLEEYPVELIEQESKQIIREIELWKEYLELVEQEEKEKQ